MRTFEYIMPLFTLLKILSYPQFDFILTYFTVVVPIFDVYILRRPRIFNIKCNLLTSTRFKMK